MKFIEEYNVFESTNIKELKLKFVDTLRNNLNKIEVSDFDEYYYVYAVGTETMVYNDHSIFLSNTSKLDATKYLSGANDVLLKDKVRILYKRLGYAPDRSIDKLFIFKIDDFIECEKIDDFVIYNSWYFYESGSLSDKFVQSKLFKRLKVRLINMIQHEISHQNSLKYKKAEILDINPTFFKEDKLWDLYIKNNNIVFKQYYNKFSDKMKAKYDHLGVRFGFFD